jgi:phosphatidylserine/phosphatidylglycerophosphate/cardiolipin synthase-like enzyme
MIDVRTLTDGGQKPEAVAQEIAAFLAGARSSIELALYDVKLGHDTGPLVVPQLIEQASSGIAVRLVFNKEHPGGVPVPPPPQSEWWTIEALDVPTRGVSGVPDLMHHKYVIRDGATVLTGSTNWTDDSWSREENLIVTVDSPELAARYLLDFEQLWEKRNVEKSGKVDPSPVVLDDGTRVWPWFTPRYGSALAHRIASRIGAAQRRVRIASPVITSAPILGTLAQVAADKKVDLAGLVDATQVHQVLYQWHENGNSTWKTPALNFLMQNGNFTGKASTPWGPGTVHDFMHAKVTVADDTVFVGSFNLSHSGEMNAENVLEIEDAALAQKLADWIDTIRVKYQPVRLLGPGVTPVA